jgi:hypothetical protein
MADEAHLPPNHHTSSESRMIVSRTTYDLIISSPTPADTMTIIVGEDPHTATFHLPKTLLVAKSSFFERALSPEWSNSVSNRTIQLPDIPPALFDMYARWLSSGAAILIDEDDWKAAYAEYVQWRRHLEHGKEGSEALCPVTVWDFEKSTEAWFLGDFLQSPDFQNHCLGHLYYMNLQFEHVESEDERPTEPVEGIWHIGTLAYVCLEDVLYTWEMTKHLEPGTPFRLEHHPLRRFYGDWLERYWDAYELPDWDYEVQDGVVQLIEQCPDLVYKQLKSLSWVTEPRNGTIGPIGAYWVDEDEYSVEVQQRIRSPTATHW